MAQTEDRGAGSEEHGTWGTWLRAQSGELRAEIRERRAESGDEELTTSE